MSREQIIRDTAYAIWEAEGKPEGRAAQHWQQAEAQIDQSLKTGKGGLSEAGSAPPASRKPKAGSPVKAGASALPKTGATKDPHDSSKAGSSRPSKAKS